MEDTLREISLAECETLLRQKRIGRLATRDAEGTYIVPVSFAYADGCIYGHVAPGRKLALMRRWPHVSFQVDDITSLVHWRSVIVRGKWHELTDEHDKFRARMLILKAFGGDPWMATAGHGHRTTLADAILYRIEIEEITGRAQND
ncbi:MAG TPA: pyridoxamine 5'-phosphate oxidase family protein [Tepidiformaceae bacterium]|nr:pyridoxamine 5'-phosphate oxidase family protein [Tepidiformaceae bacterium]